ncbi:acetyl esterase [Neorhodopirellula lusitana]|uniref:Acetyl esterase n=1 Tax=Neorhodopirellula lusitana TaxID=445327 RepID=A0ABY1PYT4_9BACT|nr:alpha/beta hydrolase [Neorhodopirellula lusitana]SMP51901.1 acetyl esterase [Neorhodopirellula lusitana]
MTLDTQCRQFLDAIAKAKRPPWNELGVSESRAIFTNLKDAFGEGPPMHSVDERWLTRPAPNADSSIGNVGSPDSNPTVRVRIHRPTDASTGPSQASPAWMLFHGGGWILGDLDSHDTMARRLAESSNAVVISVDYRRAPEHVHPIPILDCYAATWAVIDQAENLGIDRNRVSLIGDSAGGHLAASVASLSTTKHPCSIHQLTMLYPVISPSLDTPSYLEFAEGFGLQRSTMQWFWENYAGTPMDAITADPTTATPLDLMNCNIASFPPTHVITAQYDVLRDEGICFANRLREAGVPTTHQNYDGVIHGFIHFAGVISAGERAFQDFAKQPPQTPPQTPSETL